MAEQVGFEVSVLFWRIWRILTTEQVPEPTKGVLTMGSLVALSVLKRRSVRAARCSPARCAALAGRRAACPARCYP